MRGKVRKNTELSRKTAYHPGRLCTFRILAHHSGRQHTCRMLAHHPVMWDTLLQGANICCFYCLMGKAVLAYGAADYS